MEILEAFDLTGGLRAAAALAGCDHKTVAHYVALRDAGMAPDERLRRPMLLFCAWLRPPSTRLLHHAQICVTGGPLFRRVELPGCDGALWVSVVHAGQIARVTVRHVGGPRPAREEARQLGQDAV